MYGELMYKRKNSKIESDRSRRGKKHHPGGITTLAVEAG